MVQFVDASRGAVRSPLNILELWTETLLHSIDLIIDPLTVDDVVNVLCLQGRFSGERQGRVFVHRFIRSVQNNSGIVRRFSRNI